MSRSITKGRDAPVEAFRIIQRVAQTSEVVAVRSAGTANPYYAFEPTKMLLHDITMPRFPITSGYLTV